MKERSKHILNLLLSNDVKFATVSGIWTTKVNNIRWVDEHIPEFDIITTKSFQTIPNPGNREPIIVEKSVGTYANAVGLRNPGMDVAYDELAVFKEKHLRSLLNISISGSTPEEFIQLVKKFEDLADIFELNFSCPHAKPGYGSTIGSSPELVKIYVEAIRKHTDTLIFPKLTPNVENIAEIAKIAVDAGADGLVAINTVGPEKVLEKHSGKAVLYNPNGQKGGMSGAGIFPVALRAINDIREAVGKAVPIIGMGGISTSEDAKQMIHAGANVIGLGSVFARIPFDNRIDFMKQFKLDMQDDTQLADVFLNPKRLAEYYPLKVKNIQEVSDTMRIVSFDSETDIEFSPSQYAFLWIPGSGEKPFSIVASKPVTFIIRKRERDTLLKKGIFTESFFELSVGDTLYFRGPYGAAIPNIDAREIIIVSGGTGIAAIPSFVKELRKSRKKVKVFHGITSESEEVFDEEISLYAEYVQVADKDRPGEVLETLRVALKEKDLSQTAFYTVGPEILMEKALGIAKEFGIAESMSYASLESNNMCGIGMCGECECGGVLSCHNGTFYNYTYLKKHHFKELK